MRILHYSLGFPPYRSGGLTKFSIDLMHQQIVEGHEVSLLWPGQMLTGEIRIKRKNPVKGISSYEMINPLPISFDEGIMKIEAFVKDGRQEIFETFLDELHPDVIHIHTLMGLYLSFINAAKQMGIRTVFTAHDFFPICPKVTMYRCGEICVCANTFENCPQCNSTALSMLKIRILQSIPYRELKNSKIIKTLRKKHRDEFLNEERQEYSKATRVNDDYRRLRDHFRKMLELIDVIHYNSTITKTVYNNFFLLTNARIIPITHSSIADHRREKKFSNNQLQIRYLGPQGEGKGFFLLKAALDKLWKEQQNFVLHVHFDPVESSPYIKSHGVYNYSELEQIFDNTDVLVAPSIWYETFGYTVLEALSFGVPVIISGTVGSKDILTENGGIVINEIDSEKLYKEIKELTVKKLESMNRTIIEHQHIFTMTEMSERITKELYMEV